MVDTDELDKVLESNSIKSCPDDETIERVPKGHLDWLYQENARLAKINDDLREEIYSHVQWEKELNDDFTKITELANKVISLHRQIIMDYEGLLNAKMGIRSFYVICFFLKRINTSPNQWISFFFNPFHLLNTEPVMSSVFFFIVLSFIYISYNNAILILLYRWNCSPPITEELEGVECPLRGYGR